MPQLVIDSKNNSSYKAFDTDEIILLIVERDIPDLRKAINSLEDSFEQSVKESSGRIATLERDFSEMKFDVKETRNLMAAHVVSSKEKNDFIIDQIALVAADIKEKKESTPWYKDFRNILITLLVTGMMALAGVKAAEAFLQSAGNKVAENIPMTTTTTTTASTTATSADDDGKTTGTITTITGPQTVTKESTSKAKTQKEVTPIEENK